MKTFRTKLFLSAMLLLTSSLMFAQRPDYRPRMQAQPQQQQNQQQRPQKEQIEAQRIAYITRQLQLTPAEARVFWPVYNEYDAKRQELRRNFKENTLQMADIDKLSEKEALQALDNQIIESQKLLDLRKEYHGQFKSVLPATKVLKLYAAERDFQKMLLDRLRQNRQQKGAVQK